MNEFSGGALRSAFETVANQPVENDIGRRKTRQRSRPDDRRTHALEDVQLVGWHTSHGGGRLSELYSDLSAPVVQPTGCNQGAAAGERDDAHRPWVASRNRVLAR